MSDQPEGARQPSHVQIIVVDTEGRIVSDLFQEARPATAADGPLAGAGQVTTIPDLLEMDLFVVRWGFSVRLRGLDLDQEDVIELESLVQHPKRKEWYQPHALKTAITLREGIIAPKMDKAQAEALRKRNPRIAEGVVQWIRLLSSLKQETIEKYIADITTMDGAPPPVDGPGPGDPGVGADDSGA